MGKEYELNPASIMLGDLKQQNKLSHLSIKEKKGWFCSELVGAFLQYLKLIKPEVNVGMIVPGQFSLEDHNKTIQLQNNSAFGEEFMLDFDLHESQK